MKKDKKIVIWIVGAIIVLWIVSNPAGFGRITAEVVNSVLLSIEFLIYNKICLILLILIVVIATLFLIKRLIKQKTKKTKSKLAEDKQED